MKHHMKGLKNDKISSNESDPLQAALTASSTAISPAVTPTVVNDTKTEDSTAAFLISKLKLRYFTSF